MKFRISEVAAALTPPGAEGVSGAAGSRAITGWSVDSRSVRPGDLFFALRGPNFDGHAYIADAFAKGAAAAVAEQHTLVEHPAQAASDSGVLLRVADTLAALQDLARWARDRWGGQVAGVTGSAGKTTTKDVIAAMLAPAKRTASNEGNLNNHVGLPLSILRLDETAEVAVLEMGMNHAGEIRRLAEIARPNVGVVTNVGYAHIENFESIGAIAAAKRELVEALGADGVAVLNADDPLVAAMAKAHSGSVIFYGQSDAADVRAEDVAFSENGSRFRVGAAAFETSLPGRHNISNILAGIATARVYGIAPDALVETVRSLVPGKMRGERIDLRGIAIINDCYNSNPDAVRMMLEALRDTPARRRIAVLGEMLELGRWAEPLHRGVGDHAVVCGIDVLIGIRGAACHVLDAAKRKGLRAGAALFFDDPAEAGRALRAIAEPGDAILFKGSRGVRVERALNEFLWSSETGASIAPVAPGDSAGGQS
jgi:UDP-N-acetylmuramoyl-tripeptide--D-alanyl-D-alanine ligase